MTFQFENKCATIIPSFDILIFWNFFPFFFILTFLFWLFCAFLLHIFLHFFYIFSTHFFLHFFLHFWGPFSNICFTFFFFFEIFFWHFFYKKKHQFEARTTVFLIWRQVHYWFSMNSLVLLLPLRRFGKTGKLVLWLRCSFTVWEAQVWILDIARFLLDQ